MNRPVYPNRTVLPVCLSHIWQNSVALQKRGFNVCEVKAPKTKTRGQDGKTDEIDSLMGAKSVLAKPVNKLIIPKSQGMIKVLRILLTARRSMTAQSVMDKNALFALLRTNNITPDTFCSVCFFMVFLRKYIQKGVRPHENIRICASKHRRAVRGQAVIVL
ncbi:MAG: hypothetical protein LBD23_06000 [Oscillospiraceae bacterium]|nr:hypothetical protein [Oscillospiraceae bacterium]